MEASFNEISSIADKKSFGEYISSNKVLLGGVVFAFLLLVFFINLNFIDPVDTEVVV